jgi:hypothetical protein
MRTVRTAILTFLGLVVLGSTAVYSVGVILGKSLLVKNPTGDESKRTVVALGRETGTDVGYVFGQGPEFFGAKLRIITTGGTSTDEEFDLPSSGWTALGAVGYKYSGPVLGEPVKKVLLKRTPGGTALLKVILKGNIGTSDVDVVPPNPGGEATIQLRIQERYCTSFGGAAGGTPVADNAQMWKVVNATAQPGCPNTPTGCCAFSGACLWTDQIDCEDNYSGTMGAPGSVCNADGSCGAPPAVPGACCELVGVGTGCYAPGSFGVCYGTSVPGAVCTIGGSCSPSPAFLDDSADPF